MAFSPAKLNKYTGLLYEGMRERYRKKKKSTGKRIAPTSAQGKDTIKVCKGRCVICGESYIKNPAKFDIHHVDGDRGNTHSDNLVLLCKNHHGQVTEEAKKKLDNYKIEAKSGGAKSTPKKTKAKTKKPRRTRDLLDIDFTPRSFRPPSFRPPSFRF